MKKRSAKNPVVCICTEALDRVETAVAIGLGEYGFRVHLLLLPENCAAASAQTGLPAEPFRVRHRFDLAARRRLRRRLIVDPPDILLAPTNRTLAAALSAAADLPCRIVGYRGTVGHLNRLDPATRITYLHPRLNHILCVSDAVRRYLSDRIGLPRERLTRIYKGHDPAWYESQTPPPELAGLGIPPGAVTVAFVGKIRPVKGVDTLIRAMELLPETSPPHLLLIGHTRNDRERQLAEKSPVRKYIHFPGQRSDAVDLLRSCDIFIMPSRAREGLPRALLEAMSVGLPCVATSVGGMPELIAPGQNGLLVPPEDPAAMAKALVTLYSDPGLRRRLGAAGRARVDTEFHISRTIRETATLFQTLLR